MSKSCLTLNCIFSYEFVFTITWLVDLLAMTFRLYAGFAFLVYFWPGTNTSKNLLKLDLLNFYYDYLNGGDDTIDFFIVPVSDEDRIRLVQSYLLKLSILSIPTFVGELIKSWAGF